MNVAITGTKGKTTIMYLVKHVLRELQKNVIAVSSTEGIFYNEDFLYNARMGKYLVRDFKQPYDHQISEATSKLLKYNKYTTDDVDIAVFNGIEKHEHHETHNDFYDYLISKKKLFDIISNQNKTAIINIDDAYHPHIIKDFKGNIITVGKKVQATYYYIMLEQTPDAMRIVVHNRGYVIKILAPISGLYNAHNVVTAFAILKELHISDKDIIKHLQTFVPVPGRFQRVPLQDGRIVIIDYAHSEKSLFHVLRHIREVYPGRPIITIFGCGGNRTKSKRPLMGKVATENSEYVYLTNDNPRNESAVDIVLDIEKGITNNNYSIILDRQDAITTALKHNTMPNTVFLLAGKGAEIENIFENEKFILSDEQRVNISLTRL